MLIDDFVEEEETVEDKLERLFECETTRVSRRRRPYNTVSYIRQPDGRWYEIGVNGEIVPCDEELSQSEFFFLLQKKKADVLLQIFLNICKKYPYFFYKIFNVFIRFGTNINPFHTQ